LQLMRFDVWHEAYCGQQLNRYTSKLTYAGARAAAAAAAWCWAGAAFVVQQAYCL